MRRRPIRRTLARRTFGRRKGARPCRSRSRATCRSGRRSADGRSPCHNHQTTSHNHSACTQQSDPKLLSRSQVAAGSVGAPVGDPDAVAVVDGDAVADVELALGGRASETAPGGDHLEGLGVDLAAQKTTRVRRKSQSQSLDAGGRRASAAVRREGVEPHTARLFGPPSPSTITILLWSRVQSRSACSESARRAW